MTLRRFATLLLCGVIMPATALAQAKAGCRTPRADLGIRKVACAGRLCAQLRDDPGGAYAQFNAIPVVVTVVDAGRARLTAGDTLVAIDGMPISSVQGSRQLAHPDTARAVALLVGRTGGRTTLAVRASASCDFDGFDVVLQGALQAGGDFTLPRNFDRVAVRASARPSPSVAARPLGGAVTSTAPHTLGLGLDTECRECGWQPVEREGRTRWEWTSRSHPVVRAVQAGSAAELAGLRPGDELLEIDGASYLLPAASERMRLLRRGVPVPITIRRNGATMIVQVTPQ